MLRKINLHIFLFIIASFTSNVCAQATWMTDNAALLGKKRLNEIAVPGAHDAGTFAIETSKNSGVNLDDDDGFSSPDNKNIKRFLSFTPNFSGWAKTQERTTLEMLGDGIRYFDLRVCVNKQKVLMTCHGLYGAPLESILDDVKKFTDAHPHELVLLGFNHFWEHQYQIEHNRKQGELEGLTTANWTKLNDLIAAKLGGKLVGNREFSPQSKFSELQNLKKNNQVIALFDTDDAPDSEFIWKRAEENTWVEGWDVNEFKSGTLKILQNAKDKKYADKFYAIRSSVTPDDGGKLIGMGFLSDVFPHSVGELADMTNPVALGWIKNEWAQQYPINLIWSDFYNRTDLVKLAESINGIKVDFKKTKLGTDTNWTRWKNSKESKR